MTANAHVCSAAAARTLSHDRWCSKQGDTPYQSGTAACARAVLSSCHAVWPWPSGPRGRNTSLHSRMGGRNCEMFGATLPIRTLRRCIIVHEVDNRLRGRHWDYLIQARRDKAGSPHGRRWLGRGEKSLNALDDGGCSREKEPRLAEFFLFCKVCSWRRCPMG